MLDGWRQSFYVVKKTTFSAFMGYFNSWLSLCFLCLKTWQKLLHEYSLTGTVISAMFNYTSKSTLAVISALFEHKVGYIRTNTGKVVMMPLF